MARRFRLDHDQHGLSRICLRAFNPQLAADMLDRKELAANVQHELAAAQPTHFLRPRPEAFHDMRQGNDERLVPNCHDHAVGNGTVSSMASVKVLTWPGRDCDPKSTRRTSRH